MFSGCVTHLYTINTISMKLTYQEAYDKIIQAYFKDEIKPFDAKFCFCGTLCDNNKSWYGCTIGRRHKDFKSYSGQEYVMMEDALLDNLAITEREPGGVFVDYPDEESNEYEDALFKGMCAALEVLKQIHKERGENVDSLPLTKRQLA